MADQVTLLDYVDEFADTLRLQLQQDQRRWGNTWLERPTEGQEERTMHPMNGVFRNYWDRFEHGGTPIPWVKVAGNAMICWLRIVHPELSPLFKQEEE